MNATIPEGTFQGGDIEPGTFHLGGTSPKSRVRD